MVMAGIRNSLSSSTIAIRSSSNGSMAVRINMAVINSRDQQALIEVCRFPIRNLGSPVGSRATHITEPVLAPAATAPGEQLARAKATSSRWICRP